MEDIIRINSIEDYCAPIDIEIQNPLVTLVEFSKSFPVIPMKFQYGIYCIALKEVNCGTLQYGRSKYDYQEGTVVFIAPGQMLGIEAEGDSVTPKGMILLFHPELVYGTPLAKRMKDYHFFSYSSNEALHLSEEEKEMILKCFYNIRKELNKNVENQSKQVITSIIEELLNNCSDYYRRQFTTRSKENLDVLAKFEKLMNEYYSSDKPQLTGLPSVQYFADKICLSPNYFGDLIKKETGNSVQSFIHMAIVEKAKELLAENVMNVNEIAYYLGFSYPHHLHRVFKKISGMTPGEYRKSCSK